MIVNAMNMNNKVDPSYVFSEPKVVSNKRNIKDPKGRKFEFAAPSDAVIEDEDSEDEEDDNEEEGGGGYETDPYEFLPHSDLDAEVTATGDCWKDELVIIGIDRVQERLPVGHGFIQSSTDRHRLRLVTPSHKKARRHGRAVAKQPE